MSDIDLNNIRRLDGNLLLVFRELLHRRRAGEVAIRLGLSQPAISHALARLRDLFGDPLFIRRSHGLEPTQRALELGPRIEALIDLVVSTLSPEGRFDPGRSRRRFNIACPASMTSLLGPGLLAVFMTQAPEASFVATQVLVEPALGALRRGQVDLALGQFGRVPAGLVVETLYEEHHCVIARRDHPRIRGAIDLSTYAAIGHVTVGQPEGYAIGEAVYDARQLAEAYGSVPDPAHVSTPAFVQSWETAMLVVAASDAIADCPRRLAERHAPRMGLQILEPPYPVNYFDVKAVRREAPDPGVDWLIEHVRAAVR